MMEAAELLVDISQVTLINLKSIELDFRPGDVNLINPQIDSIS